MGDFSGVIPRLKEEGHTVALYIGDRYYGSIDDGMVERVKHVKDLPLWKPDVALFDGTSLQSEYKALDGFPCINGNPAVTKLEEDRQYGLQQMLQHDILIPDTIPFPNLNEAVKFLGSTEAKGSKWVFKQDAVDDPALTIVEKEEGQLASDIERAVRHKLLTRGTPCVLQAVVEGIEIDFEVWVVNGDIIFPCNVTIEQKKLIAGDIGPATGASAAVTWGDSQDSPSRIAKAGILKMAPFFKEHKFTGQVAFNQIVKEDKVYGLEFTVRPGINGTYLTWALLRPPYGDMLQKWATGQLKEVPVNPTKCCAGISFGIFPYPVKEQDEELMKELFSHKVAGTFICPIDSELYRNPDIFWADVKREEVEGGDELVCAGTDGLIAYNAQVAGRIDMANQAAIDDARLFKHINNLIWKADGISRYEGARILSYNKMLEWMPA